MTEPLLLDLQQSHYFTRVEIHADEPTVISQSRRNGITDNVIISREDAVTLARAILDVEEREAA